ncbi:hypothetical protein GQ55_7G250500 [Panicum hallii var. hallii]|uniref:Uncharacterized protein n=1 Tax=Panicum hallii var. hallii TaxID=1504633 RepID=A0A2T7CYU5_9POAL|nr:hypothetical protein GQ55_7G250500 [Panicum hallii var. hallii]
MSHHGIGTVAVRLGTRAGLKEQRRNRQCRRRALRTTGGVFRRCRSQPTSEAARPIWRHERRGIAGSTRDLRGRAQVHVLFSMEMERNQTGHIQFSSRPQLAFPDDPSLQLNRRWRGICPCLSTNDEWDPTSHHAKQGSLGSQLWEHHALSRSFKKKKKYMHCPATEIA